MSTLFRRPALARHIAHRLVRPGVLDEGLRSGLFLSGRRRTGKTTFLLGDLMPALERAGALVVYVDLWSDTRTHPATLVGAAVRRTLADLQRPASTLRRRLARVRGAEGGALGFRFGFELEKVEADDGATLARALTELVDRARTDVVLIVDEVQHALTTEEGNRLLLALKAARDAINPRPDTAGHFIFIGTGSHRALVNELTARRGQAFAGAVSVACPVLGVDYVEHLLERLAIEGGWPLPSLDIAADAFATLGHRPEEMIRALKLLRARLPPARLPPGAADEHLPLVAATLRRAAVDGELNKMELLGGLARAVFERIAASDGHAGDVLSAKAVAAYSHAVGRAVRVDQVRLAVDDLLAANLIMRRGHGRYGVSDPLVQRVWRERQAPTADA